MSTQNCYEFFGTIKRKIVVQMIDNIRIHPQKEQKYVRPVTISYTKNGEERTWEAVKSFDSVAVLLYHTTKDSFLLVKQFRPAILLNEAKTIEDGYTYELCAGICDKEISLTQTAAEEIDEECGFCVEPSKIELITSFHTCVGFSGSYQTLFYAEIDDSMMIHSGGGDHTEDIELVYLPTKEAKEFVLDSKKPKTPGLGLAFYWWFHTKGDR